MSRHEIRKLTAGDAEAWSHLRLEALTSEPLAFGSAAEDHRLSSVDAAAKRIAATPAEDFILGAFRGGALEGTAGFYRETERKSRHKGHVWGVYVTAGARGLGVGRALMQRLIEEVSRQPGLQQILLMVTVPQTAARRLYESLGFQHFGREPRALLIDGRFVDEDHYLLVLG